MSYPDPPPPPPPNPFMVPTYSDGNAGGYRPQVPKNSNDLGSYSQSDQPPPFNTPRISENYPPNFMLPAPSDPRMNPPIPPANIGTSHIFYKTLRCTKFLEGNCDDGDSCTFAHGPEDLRELPSNWLEIVRERGTGNWNDDQEGPAKFETDMAEYMAMTMGKTRQSYGKGRYGYNKHLYPNSDAIQVNTNATFAATKNCKTKICYIWKVGKCNYGERCHYAHGESELQQIPDGPSDQPREVMMMNTAGGSIAANQSAMPVARVPAAVPAPIREGGKAEKGFAKWNPNRKINRIYGDWLDDLSPPSSPRQDDT